VRRASQAEAAWSGRVGGQWGLAVRAPVPGYRRYAGYPASPGYPGYAGHSASPRYPGDAGHQVGPGIPAYPTAPTILRPFEPPHHRWDAGHRGVDLAGYFGEPVLAANSGTVLYAGFLVDRPVVVVGHGLLRTTYEPVVADPSIRVGLQVVRGERIGTLVSGHCAGVTCLHWGLVSGRGHAAVYYDPLLLLGCGAVRLEPESGPGDSGQDEWAIRGRAMRAGVNPGRAIPG
jgi:murein DD-endopeptidase MepM/ murein hydrolase activator NlpD